MPMQLIICVETDKRAATDSIYVKCTLDGFFHIGNDIKVGFEYMGGKSKCCIPAFERKINARIRQYDPGETKVIYCVDTDKWETDSGHRKEFENIQKYVESKGYEMVWFCHDVEEVYLGE